MIQLILHLFGDYVTQSDWMAQNKTKAHWPAFCHALVYSLPFLFIGSWLAVLIIFATHFAIDRWRLARFVVFAKNCIFRPSSERWANPLSWEEHQGTGYHKDAPAWLAVWLLIACDNTLHLAINYAALLWL